jgi:hypothetical protein
MGKFILLTKPFMYVLKNSQAGSDSTLTLLNSYLQSLYIRFNNLFKFIIRFQVHVHSLVKVRISPFCACAYLTNSMVAGPEVCYTKNIMNLSQFIHIWSSQPISLHFILMLSFNLLLLLPTAFPQKFYTHSLCPPSYSHVFCSILSCTILTKRCGLLSNITKQNIWNIMCLQGMLNWI